MKKLVSVVVLWSVAVLAVRPALAVEGDEVELRATTLPSVATGTVGTLDLTIPQKLVFRSGGKEALAVPYDRIVEFESREHLARHLGVLATIVVGLIKHRQRVHYLTINFKDDAGTMQMVSFEVAKGLPDILVSTMQAKARNACERREFGGCTPVASSPRQPIAH